jgi:hypothetical protein
LSGQLVSAYAASRLLERDRQTIERAIRHLAPDVYERGKPRWRLARIIDALAMKPQARREIGKFRDRYRVGHSKALDGLRCMFENQVALISAEKSLSKRREMAVALAPVLQEYQTTYLNIGRALRIVDDDVLSARAELIWQEMMDEVAAAAEWPRHGDDFWVKMVEAMPYTDDDAAA